MSKLQLRLEMAKEDYAAKLSQGRTDPIAKMLLATIRKNIIELENAYAKEQISSNKTDDCKGPRRSPRYVYDCLQTLWHYKNKWFPTVSAMDEKNTQQTKAANQ